MCTASLRSWWLFTVFLAALAPTLAHAQADDAAIRIVTSDGVTLRGNFLAGNKKSPCVLLLHDLGELQHEKHWRKFAEKLHKEGFAVLQFHFRGHGRSTEVDPDLFWSPQNSANRKFIKSERKEEVEFAKFNSGYHQYLINDIAAAKSYLDRKNDAGECNSSNLILLANGKSGALAAAWINAEMNRYRILPPPFLGAPAQLAEHPEGANLLGAVFVNLTSQIGKRKIALSIALQGASRRYKVPMLFFYGGDNGAAKTLAKEIEKSIDPGDKLAFTGVTEIPESDAKDAEKRLATDSDLQKKLLRYLKEIQEDRGKDWLDRESREARFYWRNPYAPNSLISFNPNNDSNPPFVSYDLFLPSR
jgi:hypothetical protein